MYAIISISILICNSSKPIIVITDMPDDVICVGDLRDPLESCPASHHPSILHYKRKTCIDQRDPKGASRSHDFIHYRWPRSRGNLAVRLDTFICQIYHEKEPHTERRSRKLLCKIVPFIDAHVSYEQLRG